MSESSETFKIIVAGGRDFKDYRFLRKKMSDNLRSLKDQKVEIVSGRSKGADLLGERYAKEKNLKLTTFPANWQKFGRAAGPIRNEQMAKYADALTAFWDGESKGTLDMINKAQRYNLQIQIYGY